MKTKKTTLALMFFMSIISANAQITWNAGSFICSVPDTNVVCNPNLTCTLICTITNTDCCGSLNCNQIIDSILGLPAGWYITMCNPNGCFPTTTTQNAFIVPPSGTVTAKFEIHAGANTGDVNVRVRFLDVANNNNSVTFHIVGGTGTGIISAGSLNASLSQNFPNPYSTFTAIRYNLDMPNGKLVITDVQGRIVSEYILNNSSGEIIIAEKLKSGIYFYLLYSNDKMILRNKMVVQ